MCWADRLVHVDNKFHNVDSGYVRHKDNFKQTAWLHYDWPVVTGFKLFSSAPTEKRKEASEIMWRKLGGTVVEVNQLLVVVMDYSWVFVL